MKHLYLYVCVSVSGASVLAIEILGTRIIGPFYGVSLFLWSALISVTLAALSVGYAFGGLWADRGAKIARLSILLMSAGIWLLLVTWIKRPVLDFAEPLGLRFAVLTAAFILFFPPLMLLGMVSPYAIKLKTASLGELGRSAGNLYAISTLASVVAALMTGFFLIPHFGVSRLTAAVGVLLFVTASYGFVSNWGTRAKYLIPILMIAGGAAGLTMISREMPAPEDGLIAIEHSPYAEIRVYEDRGVRYLLIDGGIHTMTDVSTKKTLYPYVNVIDISRGFFESPGRMLLIGLGGGSVVKHFAQNKWTVDAVEIDPVVTRIAYDHFDLDPGEARVFSMDGRRYLDTYDYKYEIIVLDAFGSSSIPFHLVTAEVFALIASRLRDDGLLAVNVEAVGWDDLIVRSLAATLATSFKEILALPIAEPPGELGNVILFASNRELKLKDPLPSPESRYSEEYDRAHAWDNRFRPDTRNVPVLTDELNPVDLWAERINLAARIDLHEYFGQEGASW
jgi:spermidine synthase